MARNHGGAVSQDRERFSYVDRGRLVAEISMAYIRARRLLRRHSIVGVVRILREFDGPPLEAGTSQRTARRLARPIVRTLSILPIDSRCLMRSLVLIHMMARRGARCELHIGALADDGFAAHAWVEHSGLALLPSHDYPVLTVI